MSSERVRIEAECRDCGHRWVGVGNAIRHAARKHADKYGHAVHVKTTTTVAVTKPS